MLDRKVHVGQLSFATTEAQLGEAMARYGAVKELAMPRDKDTGRFRGFAFVTFCDAAAAQQLMWDAQQGRVVVDGRVVTVNTPTPLLNPTAAARSAQRTSSSTGSSSSGSTSSGSSSTSSTGTGTDPTPRGQPVSNRVFVGGLAQTSAVDVRAHFERCGRIVECEVPIDRRTGRTRGFAFVTFASEADAMRLVGTTAVIAGRRVEVKRADPKPLAAVRHASSTHGGSDICGPSSPHDHSDHDHQHDHQHSEHHAPPAPAAPGPVRYDRGRGFTPYPAAAMLQSVSHFVPQPVAPAPFFAVAPQQPLPPQPQPMQPQPPQYLVSPMPPGQPGQPGQPAQPVYYVIPQQQPQMPQTPQGPQGRAMPPAAAAPYQLAYMPVGMPPGAAPAPAAYYAPQMPLQPAPGPTPPQPPRAQ